MLGGLFSSIPSTAQFNLGFKDVVEQISIEQNGSELSMPTAGGLNNPQASEIDLDGDGVLKSISDLLSTCIGQISS